MDDQHLELQRDAFGQAGCGIVYEEAAVASLQADRSLSSAVKPLGAETSWSCGGWLFRSVVSNAVCPRMKQSPRAAVADDWSIYLKKNAVA